jgi:rifampicin phosphotransferase
VNASTAISQRKRQLSSVAMPSCAPAELIRDLADIGESDAALVGGKAYPLAVLMRRGFRVPKGFCITAEAFRLAGGGDAELAAVSANIALPPLLRELIAAAWREAGLGVAAVRSSAAEEDGREASWAGIFPTELVVEDEAALIAAVERCFRSVHAPEAKAYRSHATNSPRPAMAILVQQLVEADAAGMVFTSNPVSGARDEIVINAVHGLGSALAAGTVSGDTFIVDREGRIKSQSVCAKQVRVTRRGEITVPREQQKIPAVCSRAIAALAKLAIEIEDIFGCPQDIEFAIAGDSISVLQSRPITGLPRDAGEVNAFIGRERHRLQQRIAELRRERKLRGADVVFSNGNVGELLPTPTPMSFGIFREIFAGRNGAIVAGRCALGYELSEHAAEALYELICGQPYFNLEVDAGTFDIGVAIDVDEIIRRVSDDPTLANYPEFGLYQQAFDSNSTLCEVAARARESTQRFHATMAAKAQELLQRFTGEIEPALCRSVVEARQSLDGELSIAQLIAAIGRRIDALKRGSCVQFVMAARLGFFFAEMVRSRLTHYGLDPALTPQLLQGLEGSRITHQALDLERLASGEMTREAFLDIYGHLASNELEISLPRLAEDPSALDCLLQDLTASGRHPSEDFQQQQRRRAVGESELERRLARAQVPAEDITSIHIDLHLAQVFLPLRETVKYYYAAEYAVIRSLLLRLNRALGWQQDDIFYLLPEEIPQCAAHSAELKARVAERRHERQLASRIARQHSLPAVIFGSRLEEIGARRESVAAQRLTGTPVAAGCAVGVVRLVDCADTAALKNMRGDEIIVARSANLGLAPVMRMSAGLIVEVGGVLAHAACQARESGIPAVVLPNAMLVLRNGMKVRLDGSTGNIELLPADEHTSAPVNSPNPGQHA